MITSVRSRKGHYVALVAVGRDFVTNVLYDMLTNHRPFFIAWKITSAIANSNAKLLPAPDLTTHST